MTTRLLGAILGLVGTGVFVLGSVLPAYGEQEWSVIGFGDLENKYVVANILTVWSLPAVVIVGIALSLARSRVRRLGDGMVLAGGIGTFLDGIGVLIFSYASYNYKGGFRIGVGAWVGLAGGLLCAMAGVLLLISISSVRNYPFEGPPGEAEGGRA